MLVILVAFLAELAAYLVSEILGRFLVLKCLPSAGSLGKVARRAGGLGALLGLISLLILAKPMIAERALRVASLVVTPLFVGSWTMLIGHQEERSGKTRCEYDSFLFGAVFAAVFGLARLLGQLVLGAW